jgi:hypothetical protein
MAAPRTTLRATTLRSPIAAPFPGARVNGMTAASNPQGRADKGPSQVGLTRGEGTQNIVARDNARDAAIPDHRHALYPVSDKHTG